MKRKRPRRRSCTAALRHTLYVSDRWRKLRLVKLRYNPLCERCEKRGKIVEAEDVHHIKTFVVDGKIDAERAYNINNLMSLCKKCHGELHGRGY